MIGYAFCGSFCTINKSLETLKELAKLNIDITPIMSEITYSTSTRFANADEFNKTVEEICGKKIIHTVPAAEPIGPKELLDVLVIAPCTGNTLGKLSNGISDTSVTLATKAHLRNQRPVIIAVSTNDALGTSARNIGTLINSDIEFLKTVFVDKFLNEVMKDTEQE